MGQLEKFAEYALAIRLADLPVEVLDYAKIVFLDTLVCGLAACRLERSAITRRVAARLAGPADATVFGLEQKVASANAAYANAEMMNALDADETFYNAAHFAAIVLAASLAEAERLCSSGADILKAFIAGFEINARLNLASKLMEYDGEQFRWSPLVGTGTDAFGAAVAASSLAGQSREQMVNAMGLAGWTAPTPKAANMSSRSEFNSFKYAPYGSVAQAGLMASLLAQEGYIGEHEVLDSIPGFFEAQGYMGAYRELLDCASEKWWIMDTALKPYPSCRFTHAAIDAVLDFQKKHEVSIEDIDSIVIRLNPIAYSTRFFREPATSIAQDHRAPLHGAFNIPYITALALLGHRRGPDWYDPSVLNDASVWALALRISTLPDEGQARRWREDVLHSPIHRPRFNRVVMAITVRGECHEITSDHNQGDPWSKETRADWRWVKCKMADFLDGILSEQQQEKLYSLVRNLECVGNIKTQLSPLLEVSA